MMKRIFGKSTLTSAPSWLGLHRMPVARRWFPKNLALLPRDLSHEGAAVQNGLSSNMKLRSGNNLRVQHGIRRPFALGRPGAADRQFAPNVPGRREDVDDRSMRPAEAPDGITVIENVAPRGPTC